MKLYFLSSLFFLCIYFFEKKQKDKISDVFKYGITEKVAIIDKTRDCLSSTRNTNWIIVRTKNNYHFRLSSSYGDCIDLKKNDSILVRYLDIDHPAIRVYNYSTPPAPTYFLKYVLIGLSFLSFMLGLNKSGILSKKKTEEQKLNRQ